MGHKRPPLAEYFYARVKKYENCWNWVGSFQQGRTRAHTGVGTEYCRAEDMSWMLHYGGQNNPSKEIFQACGNIRCVRPDHLKLRDKIHGNPIVRFWWSVVKTPGCWGWRGSKTEFGYGVMPRMPNPSSTVKRKVVSAHVFSWELHFGQVPTGLCVLHKCDNPECVRPDHLFLGTHADNVSDMVSKSRQAVGEKTNHAKLTPAIVMRIRWSYVPRKTRQIDIAKRYGVCVDTVRKVLDGRIWKHVPSKTPLTSNK